MGRMASLAKLPRGEPVQIGVILDKIMLEIQAVRSEMKKASASDLSERLATTGAGALPLSTKQVAEILNCSARGVKKATERGWLKRRWGRRGFHPDDVRAYLESRTRGASWNEAANQSRESADSGA